MLDVEAYLRSREKSWLTRFKRREARWLAGRHNLPLTGPFRRHEIPKATWLGGIDQAAIAMVKSVHPSLEIIFDKFTAPKGSKASRPGFHLVSLVAKGATPDYDILNYEFSIQKQVVTAGRNLAWPGGTPCVPTVEYMTGFLPVLKSVFVGPKNEADEKQIDLDGYNNERQRRADVVKPMLDMELAIMEEINPYAPTGLGIPLAKGRTIQRTGRDLLPGQKREKILVDMGA